MFSFPNTSEISQEELQNANESKNFRRAFIKKLLKFINGYDRDVANVTTIKALCTGEDPARGNMFLQGILRLAMDPKRGDKKNKRGKKRSSFSKEVQKIRKSDEKIN